MSAHWAWYVALVGYGLPGGRERTPSAPSQTAWPLAHSRSRQSRVRLIVRTVITPVLQNPPLSPPSCGSSQACSSRRCTTPWWACCTCSCCSRT
eukprot:2751670-Prymnesium_polylepis.2